MQNYKSGNEPPVHEDQLITNVSGMVSHEGDIMIGDLSPHHIVQ